MFVRKISTKIQKIILSRWLPWALLGVLFFLELGYLVIPPAFTQNWPRWNLFLIGSVVFLGLLLGYLLINRVMDLYDQRDKLHTRLLGSEFEVNQAYQRLQAIFQVGQKFVEATDENEVIELVLRLAVDYAGAKGASFVPLDEHNQPMAAINFGELPLPLMEPWLEYLASPSVRENCQQCENHGKLMASCPLLKAPVMDTVGIYCLPLRRGDREFGILNLYMADQTPPEAETQAFLGAMVDETALALEGVRLRRKELAAIRQMQSIRQRTDLRALFGSLLESVHQTLEADASIMMINPQPGLSQPIRLSIGEVSEQLEPIINGILQGVIDSGDPVILGDLAGEPSRKFFLRSILATPLISSDRIVAGAILVGTRRSPGYTQRQLSLLQTVAGQLTLIVQNTSLLTELEYQSMMEERKRLAREIHDGLAQTLGFLKLQAYQTKNFLTRGDTDRVIKSLDIFYETLSEAYQDAREAIDGLRIGTSLNSIHDWLVDVSSELYEISGIKVEINHLDTEINLAPEVQAQLMRIVQEAISNVRKHARASLVVISYFQQDEELVLEIQDNGEGFSPEDISAATQHGLRGMRERADLIGADFQVISRPSEGTTIRLRLPLTMHGLAEMVYE